MLRISPSRKFSFSKTIVKWLPGNYNLKQKYENNIQEEKARPMRKTQILNSTTNDASLNLPRREEGSKNSFERLYTYFNYSYQELRSLEFYAELNF